MGLTQFRQVRKFRRRQGRNRLADPRRGHLVILGAGTPILRQDHLEDDTHRPPKTFLDATPSARRARPEPTAIARRAGDPARGSTTAEVRRAWRRPVRLTMASGPHPESAKR